jgi:hypothetical protein
VVEVLTVVTEFRSARALIDVVEPGLTFAYWAPGDHTLYRVGVIRHVAYGADAIDPDSDFVALLVTLGSVSKNPHLLIRRPRNEVEYWTPRAFVDQFGERFIGWWAGVRPLLAALEWTPENQRGVFYSPADANVIAEICGV